MICGQRHRVMVGETERSVGGRLSGGTMLTCCSGVRFASAS